MTVRWTAVVGKQGVGSMRRVSRRRGPGKFPELGVFHADKVYVDVGGGLGGRVDHHADRVDRAPASRVGVRAGAERTGGRARVAGQRDDTPTGRVLEEADGRRTGAAAVDRRPR